MIDAQFADRAEAGRELATRLGHLADRDPVVLGMARGGVPVAAPVARALGAPLDVLVVRKLGVPWHPELAMGAVAGGGVRVVNEEVLGGLGVSASELDAVTARERQEVDRRETEYRSGRPAVTAADRCAVLVDDGLATGASAAAAVRALRAGGAGSVLLAVPVGAAETVARLREVADEVVCPNTPADFLSVGGYYRDFAPVTDTDVRQILHQHVTTPP